MKNNVYKINISILIYCFSGQKKWAKNFPKCSGYWQSPIILAASRSVALPLPALEMIGYRNLLDPSLVFSNNGHTGTYFHKLLVYNLYLYL
jgi:hypothetical protein